MHDTSIVNKNLKCYIKQIVRIVVIIIFRNLK